MARAEDQLFGLVLFNDWSARDIQAWEHPPLGSFLSKNFAGPIAYWIVTMQALAPFRSAFTRPDGDPGRCALQALAHDAPAIDQHGGRCQ